MAATKAHVQHMIHCVGAPKSQKRTELHKVDWMDPWQICHIQDDENKKSYQHAVLMSSYIHKLNCLNYLKQSEQTESVKWYNHQVKSNDVNECTLIWQKFVKHISKKYF